MILFYSGGGRPWVPELCVPQATVMLSAYTNAKNWKPDSRMRRIYKAKKKVKK